MKMNQACPQVAKVRPSPEGPDRTCRDGLLHQLASRRRGFFGAIIRPGFLHFGEELVDRQVDVSRGDWIATPQTVTQAQRFSATLAWLDTEPAQIGRKYWVRHGNRWVQARLSAIEHKLDIHNLAPVDAQSLAVNEIGQVVVELQQPLPVEPYASNRVGGALIVVDPASNRTSGALLVQA